MMSRVLLISTVGLLAAAWLIAAAAVVAQDPPPPQGFGTGPAASGSAPVNGDRGNSGTDEERRERRRRGFNRGPDGERGNGDRGNGERRRREEGENRDSSRGNSSSTPAVTTTAKPSTPEVSDAQKARDWAKSTVKEHDKNGDMILDKSEQAGLGQALKADTNGDGKITVDELVIFASPKSAGATPPSNSTNGASTSGAASASSADAPKSDAKPKSTGVSAASTHKSGDAAKDKRKSYRFKTAKDRLPAGLPGWFTSKDANGDGQVSMSEYSRTWSDSTAAEFQKYDLDNDGVITAEEAAKK